jgi:hypothetical protein
VSGDGKRSVQRIIKSRIVFGTILVGIGLCLDGKHNNHGGLLACAHYETFGSLQF